MDEFILTIIRNGESREIGGTARSSILANLRDEDYTEPDAPCGGAGTCHKCTVTVTGAVRNLDVGTVSQVRDQQLLACRFAPAGDLTVVLPDTSKMRVVTGGSSDIEAGGRGLGFSVDIGTTTVAAFLYDLKTGGLLDSAGERNAQRAYGADVISRIQCCTDGKLESLSLAVRRQIAGLAEQLCRRNHRNTSDITRVSVAGNTVMEHLFANMSPESIGVAPFTPLSLFGDHHRTADLLPELGIDADLYLCPCVAGYVGGDITAGLMASDSDRAEGLRLFIDIGTNGEMGLGDQAGFVCCATAAGPAFEGAEIACGMGGAPGAIDKVTVEDGDIRVHVIGEGKAEGVCGSGLIDAIAAMLELEVINAGGRLCDAEDADEKIACRIQKQADGQNIFLLQDGVYIAAQDIREVQLAKAAIRAGAETLLQLQHKTAADLTDLVIAGGFGSFMNKLSALRIGLLPQVDPAIIRHVGNAAGAGASMALTDAGEARLAAADSRCTYLELSSSPEFMDNYVEYMAFDD